MSMYIQFSNVEIGIGHYIVHLVFECTDSRPPDKNA